MSGSRQIYTRCAQHLQLWKRSPAKSQSFFPWALSSICTLSSTGLREYATSTQTTRAAHPNPGNFANRPKDELREIGKKGGQKGGRATGVGGFHNMDPGKQREIASKGGRASRRSSGEGKVAGEGGRKRGRPRKGPSSLEDYEDIIV
ncbi:Hypothetical protein PENO1_009780 [Penicillium occitanis (nom. inval.)]|nr:Hypothetical protein PENO1_009780 [Penicillium occitanis (nom. inval.)]PCH09815.1 hypothetical protein PENOC_006990 [Penicillium occitanis (nom. inval.)]